MSNDEYWDDSEFGFFNTLEDEDKLLYLYDLMIGDFVHEYNSNDVEDTFEIEFEEDPIEPIHQNVDVSFDDSGNIVFAGSNVMLLRKVATDMIMNGLILQNSQLSFEDDDTVKLTYELIGKSEAISLN